MSSATNGIFAIAQEAAFGAEAPGPYKANGIQDENLTADNVIIYPRLINGSRAAALALPGPYSGAGSVAALAHPEGILPRLLKGLMGQVATTNLGGGAYQHVFTLKHDSTPLSFSAYVDHLAGKKLWLGAVVNALNISGGMSREVKISWDLAAKRDVETAVKTFSCSSARPFVWTDAAVTLNGVSISDVENWNISLANNVEPVFTHNGTRFPQRFVFREFAADGAFTLEFNDMTQQRRFWGAVDATGPLNSVLANSLVIHYTSPEQIATSGRYYQLKIDFSAILYTRGQPTLSGADTRVTQNFAFRAIQPSGGEVITITVVNGEAAV